MKYMKWKLFILTGIACLLPIILGIALWNQLPDTMPIHFNIHNEADGWASKPFVVFGLPLVMLALQFFCCFMTDINEHRYGKENKFTTVVKWIIPVVSGVIYLATLGYSLGWNIDMRRIAMAVVSVMFIVLGNYMPTLDYVKNYNIDVEKARKINRFSGVSMMIAGIIGLVTVFLPATASVVWLILLIPYTIVNIIYGIVIAKK